MQKAGNSTVLSMKLKPSAINNSSFAFAGMFEASTVSLGCIATSVCREQYIHSALVAFHTCCFLCPVSFAAFHTWWRTFPALNDCAAVREGVRTKLNSAKPGITVGEVLPL